MHFQFGDGHIREMDEMERQRKESAFIQYTIFVSAFLVAVVCLVTA